MARGRFDEKCPHCEEKICFNDHFEACDYSPDFSFDCPLCDKTIWGRLHTVPEFEAFGEDPDKPTPAARPACGD